MTTRCIFFLCLLFLSIQDGMAQFKSAMVGINGLTCSACSRAVEMSIRKLSFVKDIEMNLENTEGKIFFKDNADVDIQKIANAVKQAGFSVRFLSAVFHFDNVKASSGQCVESAGYGFQFINFKNQELKGDKELKFVGPDYQPKKEYNKLNINTNACSAGSKKQYLVSL